MSERIATSATACSSMTALAILPLCFLFNQQRTLHVMACWLLTCAALALAAPQAAETTRPPSIDRETLDQWTAPYRGWHYHPEHVIPAQPNIPGYEKFNNTDVPCVYQLPGQADKWLMSFIAFNGQGYNSFVTESTDLLHWTNPRLAMGFGKKGEFDFGGCVIGAYLYESYGIKAPRRLKRRDGKFWTLYGCYPRQGSYELRPGYDAQFASDAKVFRDGDHWTV
jgi:hypothetical protein